jgi:hypothetical protein
MKSKQHANIPPISEPKGADIDLDLRKELGKIETVSFGIRDGRLGLHLEFTFGAKGCIWSEWTWDFVSVERTNNAQWTELEREQRAVELMKKISRYLNEAKVTSISDLKNIPVECSFLGNMMRSWRVLKEVI